MTTLHRLFIAFVLLCAVATPAQELRQVSLRVALEQEGTLVSMQASIEPERADSFDYSKDYSLDIQMSKIKGDEQ